MASKPKVSFKITLASEKTQPYKAHSERCRIGTSRGTHAWSAHAGNHREPSWLMLHYATGPIIYIYNSAYLSIDLFHHVSLTIFADNFALKYGLEIASVWCGDMLILSCSRWLPSQKKLLFLPSWNSLPRSSRCRYFILFDSVCVILGMLQLAVVFAFRSTHRRVQSSQMMEWA